MKYLLDKQTLLLCTGITKYKKYDTTQILIDIFRRRQIFISFYTIIEILDDQSLNIEKIFSFIIKNKILILPDLYETNLNLEKINTYIKDYGYTFVKRPFKFCKDAELFTINDSCILEKIPLDKEESILDTTILQELKNKVEQRFEKLKEKSKNEYDLKMYDSLLLSYLPDFYVFTFDKQLLEIQKKYDKQIYHDLDSFIKKHP